MRIDFKLVGMLLVLQVLAILMMDIYSLFHVALYNGLGALIAAFFIRRHKTLLISPRGQLTTLLFCSVTGAIAFALMYTVKLYLALVFVGVTGSPFDTPVVSLGWVFLKCGAIAWLSIVVVLALFDIAVRDAALMKPPADLDNLKNDR